MQNLLSNQKFQKSVGFFKTLVKHAKYIYIHRTYIVRTIKTRLVQPYPVSHRALFKLSYIFHAKQENSKAYTNVPAKTHLYYFISMCVRILSVAQICVRLYERTIKASDTRFAAKCRH